MFHDMEVDEFGGSMDASFTGIPTGRRSSIGVGRDGTPITGGGDHHTATGLDDSIIGGNNRRRSLDGENDNGMMMDDGGDGGFDNGGGFDEDHYQGDHYDGDLNNLSGLGGGLGDLSFGGSETPKRKLRESLDGRDGGVQWDLLIDNNNTSNNITEEKGAVSVPTRKNTKKKKRRRKMFKIDKTTKISDYNEWVNTYVDVCTIRRGVPEGLDHVHPEFYDILSDDDEEDDDEDDDENEDEEVDENEEEEEEVEDERTAEERKRDEIATKKRIKRFHRATAIHNAYQKKKRRLMKMNDLV
jgi:hypothetical protein